MEEILRFTDPEQDERLKHRASHSDGETVIKNIYAYLKQYGAVRKDVYELLLEEGERFSKPDYNFLVELLRGQAEKAWFELILQIGNENLATSLYKREVVAAMQKGIPLAMVSECYGNAGTPYDMYLSLKKVLELQEQNPEKNQKEEQEVVLLRAKLKETTEALERANAEVEKLRRENEELRHESSSGNDIGDVSTMEDDGEPEETLNSEELFPEREGQEDAVKATIETEKVQEGVSKKKGRKTCDLFQRIRRIRQRAALEKMTEQRKMEELFILLRQQRYTPEMIKNVRTLIACGITFEFLYAFIESEASETELEALVAFKTPAETMEEKSNA